MSYRLGLLGEPNFDLNLNKKIIILLFIYRFLLSLRPQIKIMKKSIQLQSKLFIGLKKIATLEAEIIVEDLNFVIFVGSNIQQN